MCTTLLLKADRHRMIERQDELAEVVPAAQFVRFSDYDDEAFSPDSCLCPIDVEATLTRVGYVVRNGWEGDGYTDLVAEPATN